MKRNAFTLIELLVVIAIIALLLSILSPALIYVKEQATAVVCQASQNGLGRGWILYSEDNDNFLIGGSTYNSTEFRWCERPLIETAPMPIPKGVDPGTYAAALDNTLTQEDRMRGIMAGRQFVYSENVKLYHCPNDRNYRTHTEPYSVYRTYAISGLMNGEDFRTNTIAIPGTTGSKTFRMAKKTSDILSPAHKYVYVEEDVVDSPVHGAQRYNLGGFVLMNDNNYWRWWDIPAYYHNDRSTLGFADGHAEKHTWRDKRTLALMKHERGQPGEPDHTQVGNQDVVYMNKGYFPCK